jgi:hypothetical protein
MKKIIIAAAIILTSGIVVNTAKSNTTVAKGTITLEKNVVATAD